MANDLNARPIKVDTAMVSASGIGRTLKVHKIYWFNPSTIAHTVQITEAVSGKVLWEGRAEAANQSQVFDFGENPLILPGRTDWKVSTLQSGTLYIYTK